MALTVLPENPYSRELLALLGPLLPPDSQIRDPDAGLEGLAGQRLLFALALDESGCSESGYRMLMTLRRSRTLLEGCVAGLVVTGRGELYTKDAARDLVFAANQAGCAFLGRPLVEATGSLRNFRVQAQIGGTDEETAFRAAVSELLERADGVGGACPRGAGAGAARLPAQHLQHAGAVGDGAPIPAAGGAGAGDLPAERHAGGGGRYPVPRADLAGNA